MNGRILGEATPEKRLAALFRSVLYHYSKPVPDVPDYADIEELIAPFVQLELWGAVEEYLQHPVEPLKVRCKIDELEKECLRRKF